MGADSTLLVGVSGIDASGKGYVTKALEALLEQHYHIANINFDLWLNPPHIRFKESNPAENFYQQGLRFDELFVQLIEPLKQNRSIEIKVKALFETEEDFHWHTYSFRNIDIILLEGIFLFKQNYRNKFDLKVWIDCPFETALKRALNRGQEGLSKKETIDAYHTIYFPARRLHFDCDKPLENADYIFRNN